MEAKRRADELKRAGVRLIDLGPGEPDFDTPEWVKRAGQRAIVEGFTRYTEVGGIPELREAIVAKYRREYGVSYSRDEVLVTAGAKQALFSLALALFDEGDEVLLPAPYWVTYPELIKFAGAKPLILPTREEDGFHLRASVVEKRFTPKTKAIIINSPCNPTGALIEPEELLSIIELAQTHGLYVICDESYEKIVYEKGPSSAARFKGENLIIVNSLSKSYAMTGWRIGFILGPAELIRILAVIQSHSITNPCSISQKAALEALGGDQEIVSRMVAEYRRRRDFVVETLNRIPGVHCHLPEGTFYAFPNVSKLFNGDSVALAEYLLREARVVVVPGRAFGYEGYIRISFAASMESLKEGLHRMEQAFR
jgi:aspartate aminotransferase